MSITPSAVTTDLPSPAITDLPSPAADFVSWTDILGAVGGALGVLSAVAFGFLMWRLGRRSTIASEQSAFATKQSAAASERSAAASERSAETAASALATSQQATDAADQSAKSAAISAREAEKLATIESTRHHNELGPDISVAFKWRDDRNGGGIYAEVSNGSHHDFWVTASHIIDRVGATPLTNDGLRGGATLDIFIAPLPMGDPGEPDPPWPVVREAYMNDEGYRQELREAFYNARSQFGRIELLYRSTSEPCHCGRTPFDSEGHWVSVHEVENVSY